MIKEASKDGRNCAFLLHTMQSGMNTFIHVFEALEGNYKPFLENDFRENFHKSISK